MLVADYASERPAFCAEAGGCAEVQASEYSAPLGVPLPFAGVVGLSSLYVLSLFARPRARALLRVGLVAAGVVGAALVVLQARVIGAFCPLCLTVDVAVMLAAAAALAPVPFAESPRTSLPPLAHLALLVLALVAPLGWSVVAPPEASPAVAAFYGREGVEAIAVADFTCPHCRALHPRLEAAAREARPPLRVRRLMVAATGHPRAVEAASAYLCAEHAGAGDAMAGVLFGEAALRMPATEWARGAGMEADDLAECMTSDATAAALAANLRAAESLGIRGIPTTFVGGDVLVGAVDRARVDRAIRALRRDPERRAVPGAAFAAVVLAIAGAIVALGRRSARRTA